MKQKKERKSLYNVIAKPGRQRPVAECASCVRTMAGGAPINAAAGAVALKQLVAGIR